MMKNLIKQEFQFWLLKTKPYDEYDVLRKEDISIVVDYEERKKSIPMYSRCISDMNKEEFEDYENQIING